MQNDLNLSTSDLEKELSDHYYKTKRINIQDLRIFMQLTPYSYVPIQYGVLNDKFNINPLSQELSDKHFFVGSKRQFFYKQIIIPSTTNKIDFNIDEFKTGWNPDKYMIYRNGSLLNSQLYQIIIPALNNTYAHKYIYTSITLQKNDRLDIFYIESEESLDHVPFNRELYLSTVRQYADTDQQTVFKIPYPYLSYPRSPKSFFVLTEDGLYLDRIYDYTVSEDNEYITVRAKLTRDMQTVINYLIFTFPYVRADWESETGSQDALNAGEKSGVSFDYSYSVLSPSNADKGIVNFYPPFTQYVLNKNNFILFGNTTMIDRDRYEVLSNSQLQFKDPIDIRHSVYAKYTMMIFKEQKKYEYKNLDFLLEVHQVVATEDYQKIFYIPKSDNQRKSFLAFVGSISIDVHYRFEWVAETGRMRFAENEGVKKGRAITFIFYTPTKSITVRNKEIQFKKMLFDVKEEGHVLIPSKLYDDVEFSQASLMLFINGTYIQPDRYAVNKNDIRMIDPIDKEIKTSKTATGIYLVAYTPSYSDKVDSPYKFYEMNKDRDWIRFDDLKAKPVINNNKTIVNWINSGGGYEQAWLNKDFDILSIIDKTSHNTDIDSGFDINRTNYNDDGVDGSIELEKVNIDKIITSSGGLSKANKNTLMNGSILYNKGNKQNIISSSLNTTKKSFTRLFAGNTTINRKIFTKDIFTGKGTVSLPFVETPDIGGSGGQYTFEIPIYSGSNEQASFYIPGHKAYIFAYIYLIGPKTNTDVYFKFNIITTIEGYTGTYEYTILIKSGNTMSNNKGSIPNEYNMHNYGLDLKIRIQSITTSPSISKSQNYKVRFWHIESPYIPEV